MLYSKFEKPVILPPGWAMLWTKPAPTGSGTFTNTIGIVRVACCSGASRYAAYAQDHVWRECDQLRRVAAKAIEIVPNLTGFDLQIAADRPP